jgi:AbrB family looped-hinge helix DNA binding protein
MKTVVSERGQIVIPKAIRDRLGLRPGQVLECSEERGRFVAAKAAGDDPVASVYGILKLPRGTDKVVEALRGKADVE